MASTSVLYSPLQSFDPFANTRRSIKSSSNRNTNTTICAASRKARDHEFRGRLVDENMIVLRKRIHEMKIIEESHELPGEWMGWEKLVYASYDSAICDAMGNLQSWLIETRPSLAIGTCVVVALSVPTSAAVVMHYLLELIKCVLSGIH